MTGMGAVNKIIRNFKMQDTRRMAADPTHQAAKRGGTVDREHLEAEREGIVESEGKVVREGMVDREDMVKSKGASE